MAYSQRELLTMCDGLVLNGKEAKNECVAYAK